MIKKIKKCRCCGSTKLKTVFDLGDLFLTGVFPSNNQNKITKGPLQLVQCLSNNGCRLVQLNHSYNLSELYGENYGYRSGLNPVKAMLIANTEFVPIATGPVSKDVSTLNINFGEESSISVTNVSRLIELHRMIREYSIKQASRLLSKTSGFNSKSIFLYLSIAIDPPKIAKAARKAGFVSIAKIPVKVASAPIN